MGLEPIGSSCLAAGAALCLALPPAVLPAVMPRDGEPIALYVAPWSDPDRLLDRVAAADGRFVSIGPRWIVVRGGPGLAARLRGVGAWHGLRAGAPFCGRTTTARP